MSQAPPASNNRTQIMPSRIEARQEEQHEGDRNDSRGGPLCCNRGFSERCEVTLNLWRANYFVYRIIL